MNITEDNFDEEFNFKPITKGLGFHHSLKEEVEVKSNLAEKQKSLLKDLENRSLFVEKSAKLDNLVDMGDLAPFYNKATRLESHSNESISNLSDNSFLSTSENLTSFEEASGVERFGAWFIDTLLVLGLFTITAFSILLVTGTSLEFIAKNFLGIELFTTGLPVFLLFYIFYFSFFDKTQFSTIGKKLVGIRVVNLNNESPSMLQALGRVVFTLISFLTLGLLVMLDVQSKLTDTKVMKSL